MPLNIGQVLQDRYGIDALLGQGGMGAVYRATDLRFNAPVALKENQLVTPESQKQFAREAGLLYRLRHPNLPRVIDHFSIPGRGQYLVMDYVEGEDLKQILAREGSLPEGQALDWIGQVLGALDYLHNRNVIHRDVKPANVKITPEGQVYLVDFGLAKLYDPLQQTTVGARGVTPGFAPPEQYGQGRTDARTDIYSVAATLYALLTSQTPPDALEYTIGQAELVPPRQLNPEITPPVEAAILRAMRTRPDDRFQTAADFRSALLEPPTRLLTAEQDQPVPAPPVQEEVGQLSSSAVRERVVDKDLSPSAAPAPAEEPQPAPKAAPPPPASEPAAREVQAVPNWPPRVLAAEGWLAPRGAKGKARPVSAQPVRPPAVEGWLESFKRVLRDRPAWLWATGALLVILVLWWLLTPRHQEVPPLEPTEVPRATVTATLLSQPTKVSEPTGEPTQEVQKSFLERAYAGEFRGTVVTALGHFTDKDAERFAATVADFEKTTLIDIQYEGDKEFGLTISALVDAGDAPDIAAFPFGRANLLAEFARTGQAVDVTTFLDMEALRANYNQGWLDMATMEGPDGEIMAGVWGRVDGYSLVWYPKDGFEAAGYEIPETWDELIDLSDQIAADGYTPWCIGIESGTATGWPAAHWLANIVLRTTTLEDYDEWTRGELHFDSQEVRRAAEIMAEIWFNDDYVYGGRESIATIFFGDAPAPMFGDLPGCWLHLQGPFIQSFFPDAAEMGVDYDFFYLPPIGKAYGKPVLISGDVWMMFHDRPEVRAVMEYLTKGESLKGWIQAGYAVSPHYDSSLEWYSDSVDRGVAEIILNADSVRFSAIDLMPEESIFSAFAIMTAWVTGDTDLDTALREIDAAWPR